MLFDAYLVVLFDLNVDSKILDGGVLMMTFPSGGLTLCVDSTLMCTKILAEGPQNI